MKNILATYSPEDVTIVVAGMYDIKGLAEDTFVRIIKDAPLFSTKESSDGVPSRVKISSGIYSVSIVTMLSSESNDVLTKLALIDHITGMAKFPIMIKDTLGSTLLFSPSSWVEQMPETGFSTSSTTREWNIKCVNAALNVGGNQNPSSDAEDILNVVVGMTPSMGSIF